VIHEDPGPRYHQSPHQTAQITADLALCRAGGVLWQAQLHARTRVPLPGVKAYEAAQLELGEHRNPEFERRFYQDARAVLGDQVLKKLNTLPDAPAPR
jgi:hypothetical protein